MPKANENTLCLINFKNGIFDVTGKSTVINKSVIQDSAQTLYNNKSGYFDRKSSTYLSISLPSEAKTLSMWVYCTDYNTSDYYPTIFSSYAKASSGGTYMHVDDGSYSNYPVYRANASTSIASNKGGYGSTILSRSNWHHVALCINGSSHYFFLDGILQRTVTQSNHNDYSQWYIGGLYTRSGMSSDCYMSGYVNEIMISSECLWTSNFSVPTEAYIWDNEIYTPNISITSTSNYGTYYGSIENLTDGDTSTYWWTNGAQSKSSYVMFTFDRPITFNGLLAQTLDNTGDCISSGTVLQITRDGSNWITVGNFTGNPVCEFTGLNETEVIGVRIYVETSSNKWLCVNEITLDYEEPVTDSGTNLRLKGSGAWIKVIKVYQKINNAWVEQTNLADIFNTNIKYIKGN